MTQKSKIVVFGNTTVDEIFVCETPFVRNEKRKAVAHQLVPGGQAATPADVLAKLGNQVFFVGAIGNNGDAEFIKKDFENNGIDYSHSEFCDADHYKATIIVEPNGDRSITLFRDKNLTCENASLDWIEREMPDIIYVDGHELALRLAKKGQDLGIPVVCDYERLDLPRDFLDYVDILIAPAKIIQDESMGDSDDPLQACRNLQQRGYAAVVATKGDKGCVGVSGKNKVVLNGIRVDVKDTTGAGDTFHAVFMDGMLRGYDFAQCMKYANRIAAFKCTYVGGRIPKDDLIPMTPPQTGVPFNKKAWRKPQPQDAVRLVHKDIQISKKL